MFSLPQPSLADSNSLHASSHIDITEGSSTLACLLRQCYPIEDPVLKDLKEVKSFLSAALKYQLCEAISWGESCLTGFAAKFPLCTYAIACSLKLEGAAASAAHDSFSLSGMDVMSTLEEDVPEMEMLSADAYHRLLTYRSGGSKERAITQFCKPPITVTQPASGVILSLHLFMDRSKADVLIISCDDGRFYISTAILHFTSAQFVETLKCTPDKGHLARLRTVSLPEDSCTLIVMLQLCYPIEDPEISNVKLEAHYKLLEASMKYGVCRAIAFARATVMRDVGINSPRVFLVAMQYKWEYEAREAAMHTIYQATDYISDIPEMETSPASIYHRLLTYRRKCRKVLISATQNLSSQAPKTHYKSRRSIDDSKSHSPNLYYAHGKPWLHASSCKFWLEIHKQIPLMSSDQNTGQPLLNVKSVVPSFFSHMLTGLGEHKYEFEYDSDTTSVSGIQQ